MQKSQLLEMFPVGDPRGRRILFDPISAITGGIGLFGNLISGAMGSSAAKKASAIQQQAAAAAGAKVEGAVADSNPQITQGAANASDMALRAGGQVVNTASNAAQGVSTAANEANTVLDPFTEAGQSAVSTLKSGLAPGGDFNKTPTMADLQIDPGYAFRLQQGQLALDRSRAAQGSGSSGAALKDLVNYSQGSASQEYQNAFNRYETSTQNRYSNLFGVSNLGAATGTTQGNNLTGAARYGGDIATAAANTNLGANEFAGATTYDASKTTAANTIGGAKTAADYLTQGANAAAAGTVGSANSWGNAITGGANAVGGALTLSQLLKNPATSANYGAGNSYGTVRPGPVTFGR